MGHIVRCALAAVAVGVVSLAVSAQAQEVLKIGVLPPISGVFASIAQQEKWALELARDEINAQGGINGRKIELLYEDGEANPRVATQKAEKLYLSDKVDYIVGTVSSAVTLTVGQLAERNKRILITAVSWSDAITAEQCNPYVFRVNARASQQSAALAEWMADKFPKKRILYVGPDYEMGRNVIQTFKVFADERGMQSVGEIYTPLNSKDFSPFFGRIRASNADVIFAPQAGEDSVRLFTQLDEFGLLKNYQMTGGAGTITAANIGAIGKSADGFVFGVGYVDTIDTPENKAFVEKFLKRSGGNKPDLYAADAYGLLYLIQAAAKKAGSVEVEPVRKALKGMSWDTPQGRKTIRAEDHQAIQDMYAVEARSGTFKVIAKVPGEKAIGPNKCPRPL